MSGRVRNLLAMPNVLTSATNEKEPLIHEWDCAGDQLLIGMIAGFVPKPLLAYGIMSL